METSAMTRVGIIGMPRSGSTIISSLVNSLPGSFIVGEPHAMARAPRPKGMETKVTFVDTRYGLFHLKPGEDVLAQIEGFASSNSLTMYGFKECWVPYVEIPRLIQNYRDRLDITLVTVRQPRLNYGSLEQLSNPNVKPMSAGFFSDQYTELIGMALKPNNVHAIILDWFRVDPIAELRRATGWRDIPDTVPLQMYAGGGDVKARVAKKILPVDRRAPYQGWMEPAEDAYHELLQTLRPDLPHLAFKYTPL
jgi:hypothetical protein